MLIFFYFSSYKADTSYYGDLNKTWFFKITYIDYYTTLFTNEVTELNTLKDSYFLINSFEFFVVNFSLFFGLIASILLCFLIQRVFVFLNYSQVINIEVLKFMDSNFFIRSQNFVTQQATAGVVKT